MRNNSLANLRLLLKAEMGWTTDPAVNTAQDTEINYLLVDRQNWLASENDWPFLKSTPDVACPGGSRYVNLPTTINFERATSLIVEVFYNNIYQPVLFGIGSEEYNIRNPALGQQQDPFQRWDFYSETQFEVWPMNSAAQTIRFTGQRPLTPILTAGSVFDDAATFDLDDLLVVYFSCAKLMARRQDPSAQEMLATATKRFNDLRASYPKRTQTTKLHGDDIDNSGLQRRRAIPIVTVATR